MNDPRHVTAGPGPHYVTGIDPSADDIADDLARALDLLAEWSGPWCGATHAALLRARTRAFLSAVVR